MALPPTPPATAPMRAPDHRQAPPEMRRAAEAFEGVFLAEMLRGLTRDLTGAAGADDPFAAMLQDEYAKLLGRHGGVGIADAVLREMLRAQAAR